MVKIEKNNFHFHSFFSNLSIGFCEDYHYIEQPVDDNQNEMRILLLLMMMMKSK